MTRTSLIVALLLLLPLSSLQVLAADDEPTTRTLVWPDGTRYVGGVLNGERSGKGTIFWDDGTRFVGQFKNDKRNGPGTMILPDGTVFTGFFKDDVLVDTTDTLAAGTEELSTEEREVVPETAPVAATAPEPAATEPREMTAPVTPEPAPEPKPASKPEPEPAPAATVVTADIEEALISAVDTWARAWSNQDVAGYIAAYSRDFATPRGGSRTAWESQRHARLTRPAYIRIGVTYERFELIEPDVIEVQFEQKFESNTYADTSTKILRMRNEPGGWKILDERSINIQR